MVRSRARLRIALAALGIGASVAVAGLVWRGPGALFAARPAAVPHGAADQGTSLAGVATALARNPQDREALAGLDAALPRMFDAQTGIPDGSWANAVREMPALLQASATTPEGLLRLGRVKLVLGLHRSAAGTLAQALRAGASAAALPLAVALLRSDQLEAVLPLPPAGTDPRERAALHTLRARAALGLGAQDQARQAFAAALAAEPTHADAFLRWGLLELWQGSREEAARLLARARDAAPTAPATLRLAAEFAYAEGDFAASAALYAALARQPGPEPNDPIAPRLGQARALIYQGDVAAAEALLSGAREQGAAFYRALAAYRGRRFGDAAAQALPLERELAGWPALHLMLGASMLQTGFPGLAVDRLRRYLAAVPGNTAAARLLAVAEQRSAGADVVADSDDLDGALGFPLSTSRGAPRP